MYVNTYRVADITGPILNNMNVISFTDNVYIYTIYRWISARKT